MRDSYIFLVTRLVFVGRNQFQYLRLQAAKYFIGPWPCIRPCFHFEDKAYFRDETYLLVAPSSSSLLREVMSLLPTYQQYQAFFISFRISEYQDLQKHFGPTSGQTNRLTDGQGLIYRCNDAFKKHTESVPYQLNVSGTLT